MIDSNIAVSLLMNLPYSEHARNAAQEADGLIAPELIYSEFTNALWKIAIISGTSEELLHTILARLYVLLDYTADRRELATEALRLAIRLRHPAYDCFYVALAKSRGIPLLTADRKLANVILGAGVKIDLRFIESDPNIR